MLAVLEVHDRQIEAEADVLAFRDFVPAIKTLGGNEHLGTISTRSLDEVALAIWHVGSISGTCPFAGTLLALHTLVDHVLIIGLLLDVRPITAEDVVLFDDRTEPELMIVDRPGLIFLERDSGRSGDHDLETVGRTPEAAGIGGETLRVVDVERHVKPLLAPREVELRRILVAVRTDHEGIDEILVIPIGKVAVEFDLVGHLAHRPLARNDRRGIDLHTLRVDDVETRDRGPLGRCYRSTLRELEGERLALLGLHHTGVGFGRLDRPALGEDTLDEEVLIDGRLVDDVDLEVAGEVRCLGKRIRLRNDIDVDGHHLLDAAVIASDREAERLAPETGGTGDVEAFRGLLRDPPLRRLHGVIELVVAGELQLDRFSTDVTDVEVAFDIHLGLLEPVAVRIEPDIPGAADLKLTLALLKLLAEHVIDLFAILVVDREVRSVLLDLVRERDDLAVRLHDLRHVVLVEIRRADVFLEIRHEVRERGERRSGRLRIATTVEDAATGEEVGGIVGIVIVVPVPEHLLDAVAHADEPLALQVSGLLHLGDRLTGERIPAPLGDPELAELAVTAGGALPVTEAVAEILLLGFGHAGIGVALRVFRGVLAAIAVSVNDVDVAEITLVDELLRESDVDAGEARRDRLGIGTARVNDVAERLAVVAVGVDIPPNLAVALVVEFERRKVVKCRRGERHLTDPLEIRLLPALLAFRNRRLEIDRAHKTRKRLQADVLGELTDLRIPRPAGVLAIAARAKHPPPGEGVVTHPGESEPRELLVADVTTAMDVDAVRRGLLLFLGELLRLENNDITRLDRKRLRKARNLDLNSVPAGFGAGKIEGRGDAVKHLHRRNRKFGLLAVGVDDLRVKGDVKLLTDPAAAGNTDLGLVLSVIERIADHWEADVEIIATLVLGNIAHVGPKAKIIKVEHPVHRLGIVAVAPVVRANRLELDRVTDRHLHILAVLVLAFDLGRELHDEFLPLGGKLELVLLPRAGSTHRKPKLVGVGVDALEGHTPALVVAETRPARKLHGLAGQLARLQLTVPAAEGVGRIVDFETQSLPIRVRQTLRTLVKRHHLAADRDPVADLPVVELGVSDVPRNDQRFR